MRIYDESSGIFDILLFLVRHCSDWEIVRCKGCGSQAVHWKCNLHVDTFQCATCQRIEDEVTKEKRRKREQRKINKRNRKKKNRKSAKAEQTTLEEKNAKQSKYTGDAAEELLKKAMPEGAMSECSTPSKYSDDLSDSGSPRMLLLI